MSLLAGSPRHRVAGHPPSCCIVRLCSGIICVQRATYRSNCGLPPGPVPGTALRSLNFASRARSSRPPPTHPACMHMPHATHHGNQVGHSPRIPIAIAATRPSPCRPSTRRIAISHPHDRASTQDSQDATPAQAQKAQVTASPAAPRCKRPLLCHPSNSRHPASALPIRPSRIRTCVLQLNSMSSDVRGLSLACSVPLPAPRAPSLRSPKVRLYQRVRNTLSPSFVQAHGRMGIGRLRISRKLTGIGALCCGLSTGQPCSTS